MATSSAIEKAIDQCQKAAPAMKALPHYKRKNIFIFVAIYIYFVFYFFFFFFLPFIHYICCDSFHPSYCKLQRRLRNERTNSHVPCALRQESLLLMLKQRLAGPLIPSLLLLRRLLVFLVNISLWISLSVMLAFKALFVGSQLALCP